MANPTRNRKTSVKGKRPPTFLWLVVVIVVVVAVVIAMRTSKPKHGLTRTPELEKLVQEWKNTPGAKEMMESRMKARMEGRGSGERRGPGGPPMGR